MLPCWAETTNARRLLRPVNDQRVVWQSYLDGKKQASLRMTQELGRRVVKLKELLNFEAFTDIIATVATIKRQDSPNRRLCYMFVYLVMFAATVYLLRLSYHRYLNSDVVINAGVWQPSGGVILPAVTVCNLNPFRRSVLCSAAYLNVTAPLCTAADQTGFRRHWRNIFEKFEREEIYEILDKASWTENFMIEYCYLNGVPCKESFTSKAVINYPGLGNCVCIFCNKTLAGLEARFFKVPSFDQSLALMLRDKPSERVTANSGFVIFSHAHDRYPLLMRDSVIMKPCSTNYVTVSITRLRSSSGPRTRFCPDYWPDEFGAMKYANIPIVYDRNLCVDLCVAKHVLLRCNCSIDANLEYRRLIEVADVCGITSGCHRAAVTEKIECDCPHRCRDIVFNHRLHHSGWQRSSRCLQKFTEILRTKAVIHMDGLTVQNIHEIPLLDRADFSNIFGGFVSMLINLSTLVLFEIIDISCRILMCPLRKLRQKSK